MKELSFVTSADAAAQKIFIDESIDQSAKEVKDTLGNSTPEKFLRVKALVTVMRTMVPENILKKLILRIKPIF